MSFRLTVNYTPKGDQANAIQELLRGVRDGEQHQVLLGVTGSGKTFTMAKVIEALGRPALVLAHNKTLAAQLYGDVKRGTFRVRGDVIEVYPTYDDLAFRIELWGDEIENLSQIDPLLGQVTQTYHRLPIYPKTHYVLTPEMKERAMESIRAELEWWRPQLEQQGKLVEAQRLHQRTMFDLEMIKEIGYCHGIENYARHLTGREPGAPPPTLLDYLPNDALIIVDESHQTVPQIRGMYHGDRSRKEVLVAYGFRLPSAIDNRPLQFEEFEARAGQRIYVSATPGPYELERSRGA